MFGRSPFCCRICGEFFIPEGGLTTHFRRVHKKHPRGHPLSFGTGASSGNGISQLKEDEQEEEGEGEDNNIPQMLDVFPEAGVSLPRQLAVYQYDDPEWNPLFPFQSKIRQDFCRTHVEENTAKNVLDRMICRGVFKDGIHITNTDHFRQLIHEMDNRLDCEWEEGMINIQDTDVEYWYRDPKVNVQ